MSVINFLKRPYLSYLSNPPGRRPLYRWIGKHAVRSIVQLGIEDLTLTTNLLWLSQTANGGEAPRYVGVDRFDMRLPEQEPLTLKETHRHLSDTGAKVKLIPGDPYSALARNANSLADTGLILIASGWDEDELQRAWFYIPRMLSETSLVARQTADSYELVGREEIDRRSVKGYDARRAA